MHEERRTSTRAWLTAEEAARAAGVTRQTVHVWIGRGWLRPLPGDDGRIRVAADELARHLAGRRAAAAVGVRVGTLLGWGGGADAADA
jgi:predicted site-specific integrase-resolvase